jgi:hypothetical protein
MQDIILAFKKLALVNGEEAVISIAPQRNEKDGHGFSGEWLFIH